MRGLPLCFRKKGSYGFYAKELWIRNKLKNNGLAEILRRRQRKRGVPDLYDSAIMLMKTHVEKMSVTGFAIMLMKTQLLIFFAIMFMIMQVVTERHLSILGACEEKAKGLNHCFRLARHSNWEEHSAAAVRDGGERDDSTLSRPPPPRPSSPRLDW